MTDRPPFAVRAARALAARARAAAASPWLSPMVTTERWRERAGGHPADPSHRPHLDAALAWLARAQDATPDDGVARSYTLLRHSYFGRRGWVASYPETTGYIIPTWYEAGRVLGDAALTARATRAARWELSIQLADGAVRGGVMGEPESPAVFNTGQVMFGWLAAWAATGDGAFADAARRAGRYLVAAQDADGHWRKSSRFAAHGLSLYNTRTAWALAEAGTRLEEPTFRAAAARQLRAAAALQHDNGWLPECCLSDGTRPLLHTLAYAVRGLLEGGRVLGDDALVRAAVRAATPLATAVREDGWMAGRHDAAWHSAVSWSCLTGNAQMATNWIRLWDVTGDRAWLEPVPRVLAFLKRTQNRASRDPGLRGGIKGSYPLDGGYNPYQLLNWATKYFVDALLREERARAGAASSPLHELA